MFQLTLLTGTDASGLGNVALTNTDVVPRSSFDTSSKINNRFRHSWYRGLLPLVFYLMMSIPMEMEILVMLETRIAALILAVSGEIEISLGSANLWLQQL